MLNSSRTQTTPKTQTHFNPIITQWQTRTPCPNPGHKLPSWSPWEPKSAPAARNFTAVRGRALFLVHDPQNNVHKFASKPSKPAFLKQTCLKKQSPPEDKLLAHHHYQNIEPTFHEMLPFLFPLSEQILTASWRASLPDRPL